jgi:toxin CcdB
MIRQFDVFATPLKRDRLERPYVVVLQSNWIDNASRICSPLIAARFLRPQGRLNPAFEIEGSSVYLHPAEMITLPVRILARSVANLDASREKIVAALDLVFLGI